MLPRPPSGPLEARDLAAALAARARTSGHRPAVSLLRPDGRHEQGFSTLAQWAAKGAHLLEVDHDLGPGDAVLVDVPAGWTLAAVCAAVWWTGAAVAVPGAGVDAVVAVMEAGRPAPDGVEALRVGPARDGGIGTGSHDPEWAVEVQQFPDQPPASRASPDGTALVLPGGAEIPHAELLDRASALGEDGPLGLAAAQVAQDPWLAVLCVAVRPLATGRATVVVDGVERTAADGDRVASWLPE